MTRQSGNDNLITGTDQTDGGLQPPMGLINTMFDNSADHYDAIVKITTLGMDEWWKWRLINMIPKDRSYRRILDLGCGTGISTFKIAKKFPEAEVVGIDVTKSYLDIAEEKIRKKNIKNVELIHMSIEDMDQLPGQFDLLTGGFIPKLVDLDRLAAGCDLKVAQDGVFVVHDFAVPTNLMLRQLFRVYWRLVKAFMRLQKGWLEVSQNLYRIIWETNWQQDLPRVLANIGFTDFKFETQPFQVARVMRAIRTNS